jgi:hypothetical protein
LLIEGSGARSGSESIPLTSGFGSGRPKNIWIRNTVVRSSQRLELMNVFLAGSGGREPPHPDRRGRVGRD